MFLILFFNLVLSSCIKKMPRQSIVLQKLGTNRNLLLGIVASVSSLIAAVSLDDYAVVHNGATPGVITTIGAVGSMILVTVTAMVSMVEYYQFTTKHQEYNKGFFFLPLLTVLFIYTIVVAFLISFYK